MKKFMLVLAFFACGICSATSQAGVLTLFDYGFNVDGTVSMSADPVPIEVGFSGFPATLGTVTATFTSPGSHYFGFFVDYEIDEADNTYFNELGSVTGVAAVGQTWEIDEIGFSGGDILTHFVNSGFPFGALDNINSLSVFPDDVSMAIGWDFSLGVDQKATIKMLVSETAPSSGFYLTHTDPDSDYSIYFSSSLNITSTNGVVPEPSSWLVMLGLAAASLKMRRKTIKA